MDDKTTFPIADDKSQSRTLPQKLHLGCGPDVRPGYLNVDIVGGDFQCDLNAFPWPWKDNSFEEILMLHTLEHLPNTPMVAQEVFRILKPGGRWIGQVPHCFSINAWNHPEHFRAFHQDQFQTIAKHYGFELIKAQTGDLPPHALGPARKWRNLLPLFVRRALAHFLNSMVDVVDFELKKPDKLSKGA